MLIELEVSQEKFLECAQKGLEDPAHKKHFENIIACDNFLYFKSLMIQRNAQIKEESYRLMAASEGKTSQHQLTNDEAYNAILRIKENTELECAIAMSLALAEEKSKLMGTNEDLELLVSFNSNILRKLLKHRKVLCIRNLRSLLIYQKTIQFQYLIEILSK